MPLSITKPTYAIPVEVEIPAAADPAVSVASLIKSAIEAKHSTGLGGVAGFKVEGLLSTASNRGAVQFGDVAGNTKAVRGAGVALDEPVQDPARCFIKAQSGAAIANAVILVYMLHGVGA